jgi:hypothetical protein
MANDSRMTVRLDPATRRKVERLAVQEGISLNEALNQLLRQAADEAKPAPSRKRYRLKPRKIGFGFDIAHAKRIAAEMSDQQALEKVKGGR